MENPISVRLVNLFKRDYSVSNVAVDPNAIAIPLIKQCDLERKLGYAVDTASYKDAVDKIECHILAMIKDRIEILDQERLARIESQLIQDDQLTPVGLGFLNRALFEILLRKRSNGVYDFAKQFAVFSPEKAMPFDMTGYSLFFRQERALRNTVNCYENRDVFQAIVKRLDELAHGFNEGKALYLSVSHYRD